MATEFECWSLIEETPDHGGSQYSIDLADSLDEVKYNTPVCIQSLSFKQDRWLKCKHVSSQRVEFYKASESQVNQDLSCMWVVRAAKWYSKSMKAQPIMLENLKNPRHYLEVCSSSHHCRIKKCTKPEECKSILWTITEKKDSKHVELASVLSGLKLAMSGISKRPVATNSRLENIMMMAVHKVQFSEELQLLTLHNNPIHGNSEKLSITINIGVYNRKGERIPKEKSLDAQKCIQQLFLGNKSKWSNIWREIDFTHEFEHAPTAVEVEIPAGTSLEVFQLVGVGGPYEVKTCHCQYKYKEYAYKQIIETDV